MKPICVAVEREKPCQKVVVTLRRGTGKPSGVKVGAKELMRGDAVLFRFFQQPKRNGVYVVTSIDGGGDKGEP